MTDTTDIKALRAESANLMILLHKEALGVEVTLTAAKFFDDVFRLLEEERQRADKANRTCSDLLRTATDEAMRANKAEVELAALKGDQVPVAFTAARWLDTRCKVSVWTDRESAVMEIGDNSKVAELYDHPQKPVVLPEIISALYRASFHESYLAIEVYRVNDVKAAIEAAGGIVKDGE